jgi:oligopeptide/dipeptide ABC transporter ATP-binding protein
MALLEIEGVTKHFHARGGKGVVRAVNQVSFSIDEGETVALIGESGSGKSTLGRLVLRLLDPDQGSVWFEGTDLTKLNVKEMREVRARLQVVFQEPYESLNPRMSIGDIIGEPLIVHNRTMKSTEREQRVRETLERVGLPQEAALRLPGQLSGGQQQRVGIARAIITNPKLIVLDEPTSSLDLSVRAQILMLLADLQRELGLAYLFISHDISTVEYVSQRIAVMYLGEILETGPVSEVIRDPRHPYTRALLSSRLSTDPKESLPRLRLLGDIGSPTDARGIGCVLAPRCPMVIDECRSQTIDLQPFGPDHKVACIRAAETSDVLLSGTSTGAITN